MLLYIIYFFVFIILIIVIIVALKAVIRGIKAKKMIAREMYKLKKMK